MGNTLCNPAEQHLAKVNDQHRMLVRYVELTKVKAITSLYKTQANVSPSTSIFNSDDKVS